MSSSAATAGAAPFGAADYRVYRAVTAYGSVDEVRRAIEQSQSSAAAVNQAGSGGETPLQAARRVYRNDLICLLLENGAEGAEDGDQNAAVSWCVDQNDLAGLRRLIERGVSVNMVDGYNMTPLMYACSESYETANRRDLTLEVFRRSSAETRRALNKHGDSALDWTLVHVGNLQPWRAELVGELLAARASVLPYNTALVMPLAAAHAARREAELVAFQSMAHDWRAQENFVGVSLDVGELRWAEREVREKRARLEALKAELGGETDSSSGSESESESKSGSEGEESEADEATGSGGGGE